MEIWELNQLSRSEIEKMRDEVMQASVSLDVARYKHIEDKVVYQYTKTTVTPMAQKDNL